jgi:hypothetical protein
VSEQPEGDVEYGPATSVPVHIIPQAHQAQLEARADFPGVEISFKITSQEGFANLELALKSAHQVFDQALAAVSSSDDDEVPGE